MTTIAAITKDGVHAMAADGRGVCGWEIQHSRTEKIVRVGNAVVGSSGPGELPGMARALTEDPKGTAEGFALAMCAAMKAAGFEPAEDKSSGPDYGGAFLYMSDEGIWRVYGRLMVAKMEEDHPLAIGRGQEYAIGAMESCLALNLPPGAHLPNSAMSIAVHAVKVAMKRDAGTGGGVMLALRGAETFGPEWVED